MSISALRDRHCKSAQFTTICCHLLWNTVNLGAHVLPNLRYFTIYTINGNNKFIKYGINSGEIVLLLPQPSQWCQYTMKQLWEDGCLMLDFRCDSNRSSLQLKCNNTQKCQGFFQLFAQVGGGGKMRSYELLEEGGGQVCIYNWFTCKAYPREGGKPKPKRCKCPPHLPPEEILSGVIVFW